MNNYISSVSSKPTLSAPVVQSRLEHHHSQQQLLSKPQKPEVRQQQHQRSKSLKGKRTPAHNRPKESLSPEAPTPSRSKNTPSYNHVDHFDSSNREARNIDSSPATDNNLVDPSGVISNESHLSGFAFDNKKSVSRKSSERRSRRHQYSDSVDEIRNVPTVSILKRPQSATDFVKTSNGASLNTTTTTTKTLLDITREEHEFSFQLPFATVDDHSKERRRSDATSSKVKRVQRRKEIKSVTEALQVVEYDTFTSFSPPKENRYHHNKPDFHESDVNSVLNPSLESLSNSPNTESDHSLVHPQANNAFGFPPLNYSNAIIALEEEMSNKHDDLDLSNLKSSFERPLAKGYKRRSDIYPPVNAPIVPENLNRRASSASVELQSHVAPFADQDFVNEHQSSEHLLSTTPSSRGSPNRIMSAKLYAGPTFHNSPAPSDLPLPSFLGKPSSKESSPTMSNASLSAVAPSRASSPSLSSGNSSDDDMFVMDEFESNPRESVVLRKQRSRELLRMLSSNSGKQNTAAAYMVPERMATSHNPTLVYPAMSLTEISESLRNLLKIQGQ